MAFQIVLFKIHIDVKPVHNKCQINSIANFLNSDNTYYRINGIGEWAALAMGMPKVRVLNGFSIYFSNEHRWQLENLLKRKITELRPHWILFGSFRRWNKNIILETTRS